MVALRRLGFSLLLVALVLAVTVAKATNTTPTVLTAVTIDRTVTLSDGEILEPVPDGYVPKINSDEAVKIAESLADPTGADSVVPQLALYTDPGSQPVEGPDDSPVGQPLWLKIPAWMVSIEGIPCIESSGGGFFQGGKIACNHEMNVVVSADTGQEIEMFTYR